MDPDAALAAYWRAVEDGDRSEARGYKIALKAWLASGGFQPNWAKSGHTRAEFLSGRKGKGKGRTVTADDVLGRFR